MAAEEVLIKRTGLFKVRDDISPCIDIQIDKLPEILVWSDVRMGDIIQLLCIMYDDNPCPYDDYPIPRTLHKIFAVYDTNWTMKSMIVSCDDEPNLSSGCHKVVAVVKLRTPNGCSLKLRFAPCRELFIDQVRTTISILSPLPAVLTELVLAHL